MPNVYVEPRPKGSVGLIQDYVLEYAGGASVDGQKYSTQEAAVTQAKKLGHQPLVARVRLTDKGKPDHWREA